MVELAPVMENMGSGAGLKTWIYEHKILVGFVVLLLVVLSLIFGIGLGLRKDGKGWFGISLKPNIVPLLPRPPINCSFIRVTQAPYIGASDPYATVMPLPIGPKLLTAESIAAAAVVVPITAIDVFGTDGALIKSELFDFQVSDIRFPSRFVKQKVVLFGSGDKIGESRVISMIKLRTSGDLISTKDCLLEVIGVDTVFSARLNNGTSAVNADGVVCNTFTFGGTSPLPSETRELVPLLDDKADLIKNAAFQWAAKQAPKSSGDVPKFSIIASSSGITKSCLSAAVAYAQPGHAWRTNRISGMACLLGSFVCVFCTFCSGREDEPRSAEPE